jgi:hypothetical protein
MIKKIDHIILLYLQELKVIVTHFNMYQYSLKHLFSFKPLSKVEFTEKNFNSKNKTSTVSNYRKQVSSSSSPYVKVALEYWFNTSHFNLHLSSESRLVCSGWFDYQSLFDSFKRQAEDVDLRRVTIVCFSAAITTPLCQRILILEFLVGCISSQIFPEFLTWSPLLHINPLKPKLV